MDEMDEIIREFLVESSEGLDQMDRDLVELEKDPVSVPLLARIFRAIHTIKGTGGVLGFSRLEAVAHRGENLLSRLRDGKLKLNPAITTGLLSMADALRWYLKQIETTRQEGDREFEEVKAALTDLLNGATQVSQSEVPRAADSPTTQSDTAAVVAPPTTRAPLAHGTAEPAPPPPSLIGEILVQAGAVKPEAVAAALAQQADGDPRRIGQILLDNRESQPAAVLEALNVQGEARLQSASSSIRVDVGLLDKVMDLVGELVLARNQILQFTSSQQDAALLGTAQRLNLITTELQEGVMKTRMQPIGNVWNKFPRVVRDMALQFGKQIRLELEGSDTELDKTIIEAVKDPLTQVMQHLDNINEVGRGIAVAFVATIYGVGSANLLLLPAAGKLKIRLRHQQVVHEMILEGVISILEGMNPRMLETKLMGFMRDSSEPHETHTKRTQQDGKQEKRIGAAV